MKKLVILSSSLLLLSLAVGGALATNDATAHGPKKSPATVERTVVDAYEVVREALAGDDLAGAKAGGAKLAKAAKKSGKTFAAIGKAAGTMKSAKDIAAARSAFGAASKALITLLAKSPALATGVTAYKCPMAKGYQKWVQTGEKTLRNPYFGKKMLRCGAKTDMKP